MGGALLGVGRSAPPPNNACCDGRRACDAIATHTNCARTRHIPHTPPTHAHVQARAYTNPRTHTQLCGCSRRSLTGVRRLWHSTTTSVRSLSLAPMARCEHCGSDPAAPRGPPRLARSVSAQMSRVPARLLWRADVGVSPGADVAGLPHVTTATSAPGLGCRLRSLWSMTRTLPASKGTRWGSARASPCPTAGARFRPAAPKLRGPAEYSHEYRPQPLPYREYRAD